MKLPKYFKLLFIICHLSFVITASAVAADYTLDLAAPHGGGALDLTDPSGKYHLHDLKGLPAAGESTSGNYKIKWGPVWVFEGAGEVQKPTPWVDPKDVGLVYDTIITRQHPDSPGGDIKIFFKTDPTVTQVNIYRLSGAGAKFTKKLNNWELVAQNAPVSPDENGNTKWLESSVQLPYDKLTIGNGINAYYRVVPPQANTDEDSQNNIFGADPQSGKPWNGRTVGKVDILVPGVPAGSSKPYKYSFISNPFYNSPDNEENLNVVVGNQLVAGSSKSSATELWMWTGGAFGAQAYLGSNQTWQTISGYESVKFGNGASLVVKTKEGMSDKTITLVGIVKGDAYTLPKIADNLYTVLGNPYPMETTLSKLNLTGAYAGAGAGFADQLWGWTGDAFSEQAYLDASKVWKTIGGMNSLEKIKIGKAYIYRRNSSAPAGGFKWEFTPGF